ncbi:MAG: type II secretion system F family protein [Pseudomonadota bacterium]
MFAELATMLNAGLGAEQALNTIAGGGQANITAAARHMLGHIRRGQPVAAAAQAAGLLEPLDLAVLKAAEHGGRLGPALADLATWHAGHDARARLVRSRMLLPGAVLTIAAFVGPVPDLVKGDIGVGVYILRSVGFLAIVVLAVRALFAIPARLARRRVSRGGTLDACFIRIPIFGAFHVRRQCLHVLRAFEMLYTAGVPAEDALKRAAGVSWNGYVTESFDDALGQVRNGATLGDALADSGYLTERARHMVRSGDSAGTLTDMLQRFAKLEGDALDGFDSEAAAWVPRLAYAIVAVWMITQIL